MDVKTPKYLHNLAVFPSTDKVKCSCSTPFVLSISILHCSLHISSSFLFLQEFPLKVGTGFYSNKENPFVETFPDPLCKLNLKETSDFVKAFPVASNDGGRAILSDSAQRRRESSSRPRRLETPSTPGRPVFSFSNGNLSRKAVPSKWDDAEKWLISTSCNGSPAHMMKPSNPPKASKQNEAFCQKGDAFAEKLRAAEEKVQNSLVASFHGLTSDSISAFPSLPSDILLKGIVFWHCWFNYVRHLFPLLLAFLLHQNEPTFSVRCSVCVCVCVEDTGSFVLYFSLLYQAMRSFPLLLKDTMAGIKDLCFFLPCSFPS